jgi:uncharacterized protein YdiU (UPF0061 family)
MRGKLGLALGDDANDTLVAELLEIMAEHRVDYTGGLRSLSSAIQGDLAPARNVFGVAAQPAINDWVSRWVTAVSGEPTTVADEMDRRNPIYVPRNHLVEAALTSAGWGDLEPLEQLLDAVSQPFTRRAGFERFESPAPPDAAGSYRTFCGT